MRVVCIHRLWFLMNVILFQDTVYLNSSSSLLVSWWHFSSLMCCAMNTSLISCLEKPWSIDTRYGRVSTAMIIILKVANSLDIQTAYGDK